MASGNIDFTLLISKGVTAFYVVLYLNFGVILNWHNVKTILKNPIGPAIGIFCTFVFMPLTSYVLGRFLFAENVEMRFGLFATGICSMGAASICWSVIIGGNIDLSITTNVINTILAYGTIPFWTFSLGKTILDDESVRVPYDLMLFYMSFSFIPFIFGILIRCVCPRSTEVSKALLMGLSFPFLFFIVIISGMRGLQLFISTPILFSWRFLLAGFLLPFMGYFAGWLMSVAFKLKKDDGLAIAVGGVNSHGVIAIFLFHFLPREQIDLAGLFPTLAIILSPFVLLFHYLCNKIIT